MHYLRVCLGMYCTVILNNTYQAIRFVMFFVVCILSCHFHPSERATLWMLDEDKNTKKKTLWSRVASGVDGVIEAPLKGSLVGESVQSGEIINIADAYQDSRFDSDIDKQTGFHTESVLVVPVRDDEGKIIGAIQMINKKDDEGNRCSFGEGDIKCVKMLGSHVSCFKRVVAAG